MMEHVEIPDSNYRTKRKEGRQRYMQHNDDECYHRKNNKGKIKQEQHEVLWI